MNDIHSIKKNLYLNIKQKRILGYSCSNSTLILWVSQKEKTVFIKQLVWDDAAPNDNEKQRFLVAHSLIFTAF